MNKIIFEISELKMTPNGKSKLNIEVRYEPLRQYGEANDLADRILDTIDDYKLYLNGEYKIKKC